MSTEVAAASGRRERRRRTVRNQIVDAARELIDVNGVDGLRIGDITEQADVARGSFYNHFLSKEHVVAAVVGEALREFTESVAPGIRPDEDRAISVSYAARRVVRLTHDDRPFAELLSSVSNADVLFGETMRPITRRLIQSGLDAGRFTVPDLEVAVVTLTAGAFVLMRAILGGEVGPDSDQAFSEGSLRSLGVPDDEAYTISRLPLALAGEARPKHD